MKNTAHDQLGNYLGAIPADDGSTFFRVWAPHAETVSVIVVSEYNSKYCDLLREEQGYFSGWAAQTGHNDLYKYVLDGTNAFADPASRSQPSGVHGPSEVIDHSLFPWTDHAWKGIPFERYVIYEIHVGAFTGEGSFEAAAAALDYLQELGINAVELMPVSQFPGERNWGYDGVFPFAPQNSYGGPEGLKRFVNACHNKGISVILDVVYNHVGPEGNYLGQYGPYFHEKHITPWGEAINYDGPYSDHVRSFFEKSALAWIVDYHIDALRVDAVHGFFDFSARTFLHGLVRKVKRLGEISGRNYCLIAESDLNDVRVITPQDKGGTGFDSQWNDDFHHALHSLLTGEKEGYYCDFGKMGHLIDAFRSGYVYTGQYSHYRKKKHGNNSCHVPVRRFVVFSQNHDQVGNKGASERLATLVSPAKLRIAAVAVILSPFLPLIFMGEEYGETAPFLYFIDHGDERLINAVRTGRAHDISCREDATGIHDPQDPAAFLNSKIDRDSRSPGLFELYKRLIKLRNTLRCWELKSRRPNLRSLCLDKALRVFMRFPKCDIAYLFNFSEEFLSPRRPVPTGLWTRMLDTESPEFGGTGEITAPYLKVSSYGRSDPALNLAPFSATIYRSED